MIKFACNAMVRDPDQEGAWIDAETLIEVVYAAVVLGAPLIRLFAGDIPAATPDRESVWTGMVGCFQEVCDYAAGKAVRIGLHNHAPAVAPTGDTILRLLREIDRLNCTHILDSGQWHGSIGSGVKGESAPGVDIYRFMEQTAPHASYVRARPTRSTRAGRNGSTTIASPPFSRPSITTARSRSSTRTRGTTATTARLGGWR